MRPCGPCSLSLRVCPAPLTRLPGRSNSLTDLFSLLHFLRHEPWSEYIWWKRAITDPYEAGRQGEVMERIRDLLGPLVLRRTKEMLGPDGKPILTLPPRHVHVTRLPFSQAERAFYDALYSRSKVCLSALPRTGTGERAPDA